VGKTSEEELERILAQGGRKGEIFRGLKELIERYGDQIRKRYPAIPRRVSGFNLPALLPENGFQVARALVGSEGTCVTVLRGHVAVDLEPEGRGLWPSSGFESVFAAADLVPEAMKHRPIGLEGIDDRLVEDTKSIGLDPRGRRLLPEGSGGS